jgi:hypothetical protein
VVSDRYLKKLDHLSQQRQAQGLSPMDLQPEWFRRIYEDFTGYILENSAAHVILILGRPNMDW